MPVVHAIYRKDQALTVEAKVLFKPFSPDIILLSNLYSASGWIKCHGEGGYGFELTEDAETRGDAREVWG